MSSNSTFTIYSPFTPFPSCSPGRERPPASSCASSTSSLFARASPRSERPSLSQGYGSVYSDISSSEDYDFSDPVGEAAAAMAEQVRLATPARPPAPMYFSPIGYPFPWVLSRPATPPLPQPNSAFSSPSTSGHASPYINDLGEASPSSSPSVTSKEDQSGATAAAATSSSSPRHGSRPLPCTPPEQIPRTPDEFVEHRGRFAGSTPGCTGPLPFVSTSSSSTANSAPPSTSTSPGFKFKAESIRLRRRKSANALIAARISGLSAFTTSQPIVASPLREVEQS